MQHNSPHAAYNLAKDILLGLFTQSPQEGPAGAANALNTHQQPTDHQP